MTETLTYVAIYLLIGWLIQEVEDAIASTEERYYPANQSDTPGFVRSL